MTDTAARDAIRTQLTSTLFVEAGAGSGKTTALVGRVCALVCDAGVPIGCIAAVTFTEKAASELRDRLRGEFEVIVRGEHGNWNDGDAAERAQLAIDGLDAAPIGTLHAFAQRLLVECPIEAALPPAIEVLDEIASQVEFDERWSRFFDELLEDPTIEVALLMLASQGDNARSQMRTLALAANANWDLVAARRVDQPVGAPPPVRIDFLIDELERIDRLAEGVNESDLLVGKITKLQGEARAVANAGDDVERLERLGGIDWTDITKGKGPLWRAAGRDVNDVRQRLKELRDQCRSEVARTVGAALRQLASRIAAFTLQSARERRAEGRLEFHDLLVLARELLQAPGNGSVLQRLRDRYTHLLLDEFQDTDPIQAEIAAVLASSSDNTGAAWHEMPIEPGGLFVVGDPKQSIYRFRRADIATFLQARGSFGTRVELTTNFRTTPPIIDWVNHVFGDLIKPAAGAQPEYRPLAAARAVPPHDAGPPVMLLGSEAHTDLPRAAAEVLRQREASDVADAVTALMAAGWQVADRGSGGSEEWRPARLRDVCILLPARTSLSYLESALGDARIPYRTETASLVYSTRAVRELLLALRAIDDPTDELALVATLRSPLFGCGDDDLLDYRATHRGSWDLRRKLPEQLPAEHPVGEAMRYLAMLHRERHWTSASELLERIVVDRRVLELGFTEPRPRDLWRRVRFVIDQARAFADAKGGSIRDYLRWTALQSAEGARVVESVLPETDDDAVRIMTIHGAKGLEFPIVIVSGLTTESRRPNTGAEFVWPPDGTWQARLAAHMTTEDYHDAVALDEQLDEHERLRLLYVACTRACDHLVVSVHRRDGKETAASALRAASRDATAIAFEATESPAPPVVAPAPRPPLIDFHEWQRQRHAALAASGAPRVVSATGIAREAAATAGLDAVVSAGDDEHDEIVVAPAVDPGLEKDPRDLELPPWMKGRYGTAIGRAVHAVLQTVDLRDGHDIDATARAQAAAEGVLGHEARIAALARAAVASDTVRAAVRGDYWRETYVAVPLGEQLLEGYVDLIYRSAGGLVVVDYKTDAVGSVADIDAKVSHYRLQGAAYALAIAQATGEQVVRCTFVFLAETGAVERDVADLPAAVAEVRAAVTAASAT